MAEDPGVRHFRWEEMEKETVRIAQESLAALAGRELVIQEFLMDFLRRDEEKHRELLVALETFLENSDDAPNE